MLRCATSIISTDDDAGLTVIDSQQDPTRRMYDHCNTLGNRRSRILLDRLPRRLPRVSLTSRVSCCCRWLLTLAVPRAPWSQVDEWTAMIRKRGADDQRIAENLVSRVTDGQRSGAK